MMNGTRDDKPTVRRATAAHSSITRAVALTVPSHVDIRTALSCEHGKVALCCARLLTDFAAVGRRERLESVEAG